MKRLFSLCFLTSVLVMTTASCSTKPQPTLQQKPVVQANLLQKQETDGTKLKQLDGTDGLAVTSSLEYWRDKYFTCAVPYNGLIDVILKQQN
ncbi:conserved hypothetical protein [Erwinia phage phiEa21-4]|uniref:Uncharacterized protein 13 n=1 Tax=Erwinia phage phiEa21-4 TaxID=557393 RepID=B8QTR1_9CAUD|nr:hypothetical protein Ea21-4_gp13 [Erwinia phage phiEa21-4]ACH88926.1 conserved hypothetical protein [Erwinia phage phiEa21-4]